MKQPGHFNAVQDTTLHPYKFDTNGWAVFSLICLTLMTMVYIQQNIVLTDQVYFNTWNQHVAYERVETLLKLKNKWLWLAYAVTPLLVLLQIFFVAVCLTTGALINNSRVGFRFFFGLVLRCYPVLMLNSIVVLLAVLLFKEIDTVTDFQNMDYFSAAALMNIRDLTAWYIYPLKVINVVEILFWLMLSWSLSRYIGRPLINSLKFVAGSYGVGLLLWVLFVMFMQLNLS